MICNKKLANTGEVVIGTYYKNCPILDRPPFPTIDITNVVGSVVTATITNITQTLTKQEAFDYINIGGYSSTP